ncbi:hypothetical protein AB1N83_011817 [Pleurotus pulmonarius]
MPEPVQLVRSPDTAIGQLDLRYSWSKTGLLLCGQTRLRVAISTDHTTWWFPIHESLITSTRIRRHTPYPTATKRCSRIPFSLDDPTASHLF